MNEPPPEDRPALLRFFLVLLAVTAAETGAAWLLLARPGLSYNGAATLLALAVLAYIAAVAAAAFRFLWNPVLAPYPPREPTPGAVRRRFQSFGLGIVNMGGSVHVVVDDEHLHLTPLAVWRWLGARSASIPWSALTPVGRSGRIARVGGPRGCRLEGPEWCMKLVVPSPETD